MLQGRLEALLLMAVERDILLSLDQVRIIDVFCKDIDGTIQGTFLN